MSSMRIYFHCIAALVTRTAAAMHFPCGTVASSGVLLILTLLSFTFAQSTVDLNISNMRSEKAPRDIDNICVSPDPVYPSWKGRRLIADDCREAWNELYERITRQHRVFTYWFQDPAPKTSLQHRTPFGAIHGTLDYSPFHRPSFAANTHPNKAPATSPSPC